MSINIIIRGGGKGRQSDEEVAAGIARQNEAAAVREKHEYRDKSRKIRKAAEKYRGGNGLLRLESVMDARTYFRHETENPGAMADDTYVNELLRDNPEIDCR